MTTLELFYTPTSPFVRKIVIAAHELGLRDRLKLIQLPNSPTSIVDELNLYPLASFVPSLVTPSGSIYDSSIILQYLDSLSLDPNVKILPPATDPRRWDALTYEALCKGVLGAAMMVVLRGEKERNGEFAKDQLAKIKRGFTRLATKLPIPDAEARVLSVQGIALASLLWYLERKWSDIGWREWDGGNRLVEWFDQVERRPGWREEEAPSL